MTHTNIEVNLAPRFLKLLDPNGGGFIYQTFDDREYLDEKDASLTDVIAGPAQPRLLDLHARGAGIYVTVNASNGRGRKSEDITHVRAVWREADSPDLPALPIEPTMVVETSPGHCHEYFVIRGDDWPADEQGRKDFDGVLDRMVETYGSDKGAKGINRVLRVPGFCIGRLKRRTWFASLPQPRGVIRAQRSLLPFLRLSEKEAPREWTPRHDDDRRVADALNRINADDRDVGLSVAWRSRPSWRCWSRAMDTGRQSAKFDERDQEKVWRSFNGSGIGLGTLFHRARQGGWQEPRLNGSKAAAPPTSTAREQPEEPDGTPADAVSLDQFRAYMPQHNYIYMPTREPWPGASVNARLGRMPVLDADGKPALDERGFLNQPASTWLDQNKSVEQMTWSPGLPALISIVSSPTAVGSTCGRDGP